MQDNSKLETQNSNPDDLAARRQALREENRKLRFLRFLVDLALAEIRAGSFTPAQARQVMENVRSQALQLFPGKDTAFEWIYRPRFHRAITETFKLQIAKGRPHD